MRKTCCIPASNSTSTASIRARPRRASSPPGMATKKSSSRSAWSDARWTSMKPPAPGPVSGLSATQETKAAAMQASTALPPSARISAPVCAVSGCPAATAPFMREGYPEPSAGLQVAQEARRLEHVLGLGELRRPTRSRRAEAGASSQSGGDHRDPDLAGETLVDGGAEDDVGLLRRGLAHYLSCLVDLEQREVVPAGDRKENASRADDLGVDEGRAQRALGRLARAGLPRREADPHDRGPCVAHDRAHVCEIEVDEAGHRDEVADALHALAQDVVGDAKRVEHRRRALEHLEQPVVRDDDDGVADLAELVHALLSLRAAPTALEAERERDDPDRERSDLARDPRDDRCCSGARPAAFA